MVTDKLLSSESELSCAAVVNDGLNGISFELGDPVIKLLLDEFNIKVQKSVSGYVCYQGINLGASQTARSEGEAFALFLKHAGLRLERRNISQEILNFCRMKWG